MNPSAKKFTKRSFPAVNSSGARAELGPLGATAPLHNPRKAKTGVTCARILKRSRDSKRPELNDVPYPVNSAEFSVSCASIHDNVSQTGSNRVAVHSEWTATVSWRGLKPSQAPIFAQPSSEYGVVVASRALCDKHERPTVVRRYIHQTRLGVRCYR